MLYTSTRNNSIKVSASQAIAQGISEEGGLFVPCSLPDFSLDKINSMVEMNYINRDIAERYDAKEYRITMTLKAAQGRSSRELLAAEILFFSK